MASAEYRRRATTSTITNRNGEANGSCKYSSDENTRPFRQDKKLGWARFVSIRRTLYPLRQKRANHCWFQSLSSRQLTLFLTFSLTLLVFLRYGAPLSLGWCTSTSTGPCFYGSSASFQRKYYERVQLVKKYSDLYDVIYKLSSERLLPPDQTDWPDYERRSFELQAFYGDSIEKCDLTIVVTDPRLAFPKYLGGPGQPIWFALESVGAFAPEACVLLQSSTCAMEEYLGESTRDKVLKEINEEIYNNALPLFRRMIEAGHVRLTMIDHEKYNLMDCKNYGNPTPAYVNRLFWEQEFIEGIDSDLVMVFQGDAVLCYPLEIAEFSNYSFVGGVWPRKSTPLTPEPMEGSCLGMPSRWKNWLLPQRRWEMQQQANETGVNLAGKRPAPEPREKLLVDFPKVCESGRGPLGNGGLSLRSRKWMIQAIMTCPHVSHSGINITDEPLACKVFEQVNEDFYFGTVLAGIGAPLPDAYTASLFATEMLWPEQVWEMYGIPEETKNNLRGSFAAGKPYIWSGEKKLTIPNGLHKVWWYHPNKLLRSDSVDSGCRFLKYVFTPLMSRWKDMTAESTPWIGIGS